MRSIISLVLLFSFLMTALVTCGGGDKSGGTETVEVSGDPAKVTDDGSWVYIIDKCN